MVAYKGKAKCSYCGTKRAKRAKFRASRDGMHSIAYACHEHKERIAHMENPVEDSGHFSEADYQTWMRL